MSIHDSLHRLHTALGPERFEVTSMIGAEVHVWGTRYELDSAQTLADDLAVDYPDTQFQVEDRHIVGFGTNPVVYEVGPQVWAAS
jgi:hypothetical protein